MSDQLSVLVFGASRGIGRATAVRYQAAGHRVAGTHRPGGGVPEGVLPVEADITDPDQIDAALSTAIDAHGPLDVLVITSGITRDALLLRMTDDDIDAVIQTNLVGPMYVIRRAVKRMWSAKKGSIVVLSSTGAKHGQVGQSNYTASKAGLEGFVRSVAREGATRNIRINVVAPGATDTDMLGAIPDQARDAMVAQIPMRRIAHQDEIVDAIVGVASWTYATGQTYYVSGGA